MEALIKLLTSLHPDVDFLHTEKLIDNKVLDSFDIVTIIAEVDNEYGVTIPVDEIVPDNFNSAEALYKLIQKLMEEDD